jgi:hypothetical protein
MKRDHDARPALPPGGLFDPARLAAAAEPEPLTVPLSDAHAAAGRGGRDGGITAVTGSNEEWADDALRLLRRMHREHEEATGEDIRVWLGLQGLAAPSDPHAWGALTNHALRLGIIDPTGEWRPMRDPRSHARQTRVYRLPAG